ncbi:CASP-like protein ARALYDRAFT_485429 [Rutidosis leptorrhynchoides]|uniref:CASP-like protein ARALYDRAFT_485429 n=1 Tax=Rutidosis leptorrhynchoides TaxID=125765 RepID=UPI003A999B04
MEPELPGSMGTSASLALRLGQAFFSLSSLLFMCLGIDFYAYTSFCFLVTINGLVIPWSLTLAIVDAFSVFVKRLSHQVQIVMVIVIGDWILSFLSLAAACSTASVSDFMVTEAGAAFCDGKMCSRFQLSATMACLSWSLSLASALLNLWLLPYLYSNY